MTIRQITTLSLEDDAVTIAKIDGSEGTSGQIITTDGTNASWGSAGDDWTIDLGSTNIHPNNYTDWTIDLGSTNIHQNNYTDWTADLGSTNIHPNNYNYTDWTADLGSTNIHQNNYTDWTTDLGSTNIHQNNYTDWTTDLGSTNIHQNNYNYTDWTTDLGSTNIHQNNYTDWTIDLGSTNIHPNNYTDTNTTYVSSDFDHNLLTNYTEAKHIDWAISQGSLGSKIHSSNLESIVLTTVQTAATQAAHLALSTEEGDVVVRSDENKSYIHNSGTAGTMSDFTLLATPTDVVLSVNGQTGVVVTDETFASGTKMVFFQSAAPTGWSQDTSNNDKALRVVSTAGGGIGGTNNFSTTHTHSHGHSLTGAAHTLTTAEMPSHSHTINVNIGQYSPDTAHAITSGTNNGGENSGSTGGGGSHSHGISGAVSSTSISAYKYIDVIVCSKD